MYRLSIEQQLEKTGFAVVPNVAAPEHQEFLNTLAVAVMTDLVWVYTKPGFKWSVTLEWKERGYARGIVADSTVVIGPRADLPVEITVCHMNRVIVRFAEPFLYIAPDGEKLSGVHGTISYARDKSGKWDVVQSNLSFFMPSQWVNPFTGRATPEKQPMRGAEIVEAIAAQLNAGWVPESWYYAADAYYWLERYEAAQASYKAARKELIEAHKAYSEARNHVADYGGTVSDVPLFGDL